MSSFQPGDQQEGAKLTEEERKLVARLFSDPTYFPIEFRTWLKNYIEGAGITITAGQIRGGGGSSRTGMPPGLFIACASIAAVPLDALACDGAAVSRTTYSILFGKVGTSWGPGDGSSTFNVPDVKDRALFGAGAYVSPGATDGQAAASRKGAIHQHGTHGHGASLSPGAVGFNPNPGTGSVGAPTGAGFDRNLVTDTVSIAVAQVGVSGGMLDAVNWAGAVYAITTGQS